MTLAGIIEDAFVMKDLGIVLSLTRVEGMPRKDLGLVIAGHPRTLVEVGKNGTDGQAVSARSCLTGKPVAPLRRCLD